MDLAKISADVTQVLAELVQEADLRREQILIVGCSTSEVLGKKIGTAGTDAVAHVIMDALIKYTDEHGIRLAIQCCEHLNRALVVEGLTAAVYGLEIVHVVPTCGAGGALAAEAMRTIPGAVVVENIQAHAGIDIGETLIGMHLKAVAVPLRLATHTIGQARVTAAKTRPKLIGGPRAVYERC